MRHHPKHGRSIATVIPMRSVTVAAGVLLALLLLAIFALVAARPSSADEQGNALPKPSYTPRTWTPAPPITRTAGPKGDPAPWQGVVIDRSADPTAAAAAHDEQADGCDHGNSEQTCKPDPQPDNGQDCDEHGQQGGVNEDHCAGVPSGTSTTTPSSSTTATSVTSSPTVEQTTPSSTSSTTSTTTSPSVTSTTSLPSVTSTTQTATKPPYTRKTFRAVIITRHASATATLPNETVTATDDAKPPAAAPVPALAHTGSAPLVKLVVIAAIALLLGALGHGMARQITRRH